MPPLTLRRLARDTDRRHRTGSRAPRRFAAARTETIGGGSESDPRRQGALALDRPAAIRPRAAPHGALALPPIRIAEKFALIREHWRPKVIAELNGQEVKLVKFQGVFPWHRHEHEDEMFLVWKGTMRVEFEEHRVELNAGELYVVPKGLLHRTCADDEAEVIVFEPANTRNTGDVVDDDFTAPLGDRI